MFSCCKIKQNTKSFLFLKFYFIFKLYIIVLVLPNIKMNPPQVYMCFFAFAGPVSHRAFSLWSGLRNVLEGGAESVFLRAQTMWLTTKTKTHPAVLQVFINRSLPGMTVVAEGGEKSILLCRLTQGPPPPQSLPCCSPLDPESSLALLFYLPDVYLYFLSYQVHSASSWLNHKLPEHGHTSSVFRDQAYLWYFHSNV